VGVGGVSKAQKRPEGKFPVFEAFVCSFLMPTRLADGFGLESALLASARYTPTYWVPRSLFGIRRTFIFSCTRIIALLSCLSTGLTHDFGTNFRDSSNSSDRRKPAPRLVSCTPSRRNFTASYMPGLPFVLGPLSVKWDRHRFPHDTYCALMIMVVANSFAWLAR
jgi:hypothetical protein